MDNPEYTFQVLEVFSKIRTKDIPRELEEYISYVARTGEPVFQWSLVKVLLKEKLLAVLEEFLESGSSMDIPPCPNVEVFNYENMKNNLLTRLDSFVLPPFTIQRICELLTAPRKEYNRIDKYMRAVEKNVLVVSASDLSLKRGLETDGNDSVINGILYDKLNDSLNSFTNHIFSDEPEDELNVTNKLDETDTVQQIINESWNEENNEFKLNDSNNSSSLNVTFENELRFVVDNKNAEEKSNSCESKESDTSFSNNSILIEPTIQNIIAENSDISFENMTKPDSTYEDTSTKNNTSYEFKEDTNIEEISKNLVSENEIFSTSCSEVSSVDNQNLNSVEQNSESTHSMNVIKMVDEKVNSFEYDNNFVDSKTVNTIESIEDVLENENVNYSDKQSISMVCAEKKETMADNFSSDIQAKEIECNSNTLPENTDAVICTSEENIEKNSFFAGDSEELIEKSEEKIETNTEENTKVESD